MWHKNLRYLGIKQHCKPMVHMAVFICEKYSLVVFQNFVLPTHIPSLTIPFELNITWLSNSWCGQTNGSILR